ncbi:MAG: hypothetical protein IPJ88_04600 [Myxococcales bacterium]|nr:MAG: hypothetical protein IPJ88_04600 [Myxococcales bacterium]
MIAVACAQTNDASLERRKGAAEAYDAGAAAFLAENYEVAARWFDTAYRLWPSAIALGQSIRAYLATSDLPAAANRALLLLEKFPMHPASVDVGMPTLKRAEDELGKIRARCEACTLLVNDRLVEQREFFVLPEQEILVSAEFSSGVVKRRLSLKPQEVLDVELQAPAQSETVDEDSNLQTTLKPASGEKASEPKQEGLSPLFVYTGIGLSSILLGLTIWSGMDMLAGIDDYENNPTAEALDKDQSKELRTSLFIGATALSVLATATVALFFTDWSDGDKGLNVALSDHAVGLNYQGSL